MFYASLYIKCFLIKHQLIKSYFSCFKQQHKAHCQFVTLTHNILLHKTMLFAHKPFSSDEHQGLLTMTMLNSSKEGEDEEGGLNI